MKIILKIFPEEQPARKQNKAAQTHRALSCENTYPDCNLQFLKRSFEADLEQVVNHLGRDDLQGRTTTERDDWNTVGQGLSNSRR